VKVFFAAVSDFKPRVGGVAELTHNLAVALARRGNEVIVAARPQQGDAAYDGNAPFSVARVPAEGRKAALRDLILESQPDVTVVNVLGGGWGAAKKAARRLGIPLVVLVHGQEISPGGKLLPRLKTRLALALSDCVIANSTYTRDLAIAAGARAGSCRVVNPGVAFDTSAADGPTNPGLETALGGRTVILSLSRLIRRKGFDYALRALAPLLASREDLVYVVAGGGAMEDELRGLADSLGLGGKVVFTGPVDDATKRYLMNRQALFLMPNRDLPNGDVEGFGIVFLEANAAGKPVIGGRAGGVPDAIEDGRSGLLVDPEDEADIRSAVERLLKDPEAARQMGMAGRERALARFGWDSRAEAFEEALRAAFAGKREAAR